MIADLYAIDFPLREKYPDVKTIESEELYKNLNNYLLIDVRSRYEFLAIRMQKAHSVPLSHRKFIINLEKFRNKSDKAIVFYCNGIICAKSYKAYQKAQKHGIDNIFAYDAGIFNWAKKYPDQTTLLGENPANLDLLLSNTQFKAHLLPLDKFTEKMGDNAIVIDVRDEFQRENKIFENSSIHIPIDEVVVYAAKKAKGEKTLLLYDAVGKQVRWLQFYLEKAGVTNYYFLENGVKGYLEK